MSRRRVVLKSNLKKVLLDLLVSGQGRNLSFSNKKNKKQQQQQQQTKTKKQIDIHKRNNIINNI